MPAKQTFLVRRLANGTQFTVHAFSPDGAMRLFIAGYGPPIGEDYGVKVREQDGWYRFRVTGKGKGFRKLAG